MAAYQVIMDTDIGCDIDDAVCLAYLLSHPDCELLGVTTVNGDTVARAKLASALCIAAEKDVPIFPGVKDTLLARRMRKPVPQESALAALPHRTEFDGNGYLDFLRDTILDRPGQVTLLAVGPLTNIALLFSAHPETAAALRSLVLMGGNFMNPVTGLGHMESNTMCDPHASQIVYRAQVPVHRSVGCDVTNDLFITRQRVLETFPLKSVLAAVLPMAEVYFAHGAKAMYFHDLCAASSIFDEELVAWNHGLVEVELHADALMGMTVVKHAAYLKGHHQIAQSVHAGRFHTSINNVLGI